MAVLCAWNCITFLLCSLSLFLSLSLSLATQRMKYMLLAYSQRNVYNICKLGSGKGLRVRAHFNKKIFRCFYINELNNRFHHDLKHFIVKQSFIANQYFISVLKNWYTVFINLTNAKTRINKNCRLMTSIWVTGIGKMSW